MRDLTDRDTAIAYLGRDRLAAHQILFRHRHPDVTPEFHRRITALWHSRLPRGLVMAFREAGKSTIAEEAIIVMALLREFKNGVIIGENEARAADRLAAIKYELAMNEQIRSLFGDQIGEVWGYAKIILRNGTIIQALGRRQEVRGMKHLDTRPDLLFGDDLESKEHVRDAAARHDTLQWLFAEVMPALDKNARVRIQATPLDREALPMTIAGMPAWGPERPQGWKVLKFPIKYRSGGAGDDDAWTSSWPGRYPLSWIDGREAEMYRLGLHHDFMREYMCEAEDPARKIFTAGMFHVVPRVHVWQPTFAFYDPARTATETSSSTGWAVWSWIANRLVVWDGGGGVWKPDEIIDHIFKINNTFGPVQIGVERDGLEEFLLQPIRQEMIKRGVILPLLPVKAPKGKGDFIEGLQPFFNAGEVEFAKDIPELRAQFLSYPTGRIDGPNALAYCQVMRPGQPIYENFANWHAVESLPKWDRIPIWLALNATQGLTTGVLCQLRDGALYVLADFVREGDPGAALEKIYNAARLEADRDIRCIAGKQHFEQYDIVGLRGAMARLPQELRRGGPELDGREVIRGLLQRTERGLPCVAVAHAARWTLNGFACGYAREVTPAGVVRDAARPGIYRVLMEGLECFAGLLKIGMIEDDKPARYRYTATGERYKTILPGASEPRDEKANWIGRTNDIRRFR
jgi:hypothetical protein